ncbi:hypothetical protein V1291_000266 [Nitrobacteraceae bacterium AZCC 1564]
MSFMAKIRARPVKSDTNENENTLELTPTVPHEVAETTRLIRLTPIGNDLSMPHRQVALVAAETEDQARQLAYAYDPFGRDWKNVDLFSSDSFDDTDTHVIGDVIFKSTPSPRPQKQKGKTEAK